MQLCRVIECVSVGGSPGTINSNMHFHGVVRVKGLVRLDLGFRPWQCTKKKGFSVFAFD